MRRLACLGALCAIEFACATDQGPAPLAGKYALATINGASPPVVVWDTVYSTVGSYGEIEALSIVLADTLEFIGNDSLARQYAYAFVLVQLSGRRDSAAYAGVQISAYLRSGDRIVHGINLGERQIGPDTLFIQPSGALRDNARTTFLGCCVTRSFVDEYHRVGGP